MKISRESLVREQLQREPRAEFELRFWKVDTWDLVQAVPELPAQLDLVERRADSHVLEDDLALAARVEHDWPQALGAWSSRAMRRSFSR